MAQVIKLHGGPMHGQTVTLEDGRDHIHIEAPDPRPLGEHTEAGALLEVPRREGMYSRVRGWPGDFEWDGWRTHE